MLGRPNEEGMKLNHALPRIAAATVPALVFLAFVGATAAYAAPDPDNHGHHYGQLKHPKHPVPTPVPIPTPHPTPAPVSTPAPVFTPAPTFKPVTSGTSQPAAASPATTLPVAIPSLAPAVQKPAVVKTAPRLPVPGDPLWWLVLAILPALAAILLIALRGIVLRAARPATKPVPAKSAAVPAA